MQYALRPPALLPWLLALLALAASPSAAQLSDPGEPQPTRAEIDLPGDFRLGLEVVVALDHAIGFVDDEHWLKRLGDIGYRVAAVADDRKTHYSFAVLDLPEPNALALPGGFLMVTRGLMDMGVSDDELAHLLGHEISHVQLGHHARAARVGTVLSLARTALLVGVLMGTRNDSGSRERVEVSDDPGRRDWSVGVTGQEALIQASSIFGGVLQTLLERGYSRSYEFEADENGQRLAVWAGYRPDAGVALLDHLHERSYEGNRYSYWRTHPYFEDRIARARVRVSRHRPPSDAPDDTAYRQQQALFFAQAAEGTRDEDQALQLFRRALWCEPGRVASLPAGLSLARFKGRREGRLPPILRRIGPVVAAYDSVLARAAAVEPEWSELEQARRERDALARQRDDLLAEYERSASQSDASTQLLERFIENYPDHARLPEVRFRLGLHLALGGRPDEAIEEWLPLVADPRAGAWADSARTKLLEEIPEVRDLALCHRLQQEEILTRAGEADTLVSRAARRRLDDLVAAELTLDQGGRFLTSHPDTPWSEAVREKLAERAEQAYLAGRVQEGMQRYQEALDAYFEVLAFAGDTPAADRATEGVDRINRLETLD